MVFREQHLMLQKEESTLSCRLNLSELETLLELVLFPWLQVRGRLGSQRRNLVGVFYSSWESCRNRLGRVHLEAESECPWRELQRIFCFSWRLHFGNLGVSESKKKIIVGSKNCGISHFYFMKYDQVNKQFVHPSIYPFGKLFHNEFPPLYWLFKREVELLYFSFDLFDKYSIIKQWTVFL